MHTAETITELSDTELKAHTDGLAGDFSPRINAYWETVISPELDRRDDIRSAAKKLAEDATYLLIWLADGPDDKPLMQTMTGLDLCKTLRGALEYHYYSGEYADFHAYALAQDGSLALLTVEGANLAGEWTEDDYSYTDHRIALPDGTVILEFHTRIDGRA